jgi:hypothetical protein
MSVLNSKAPFSIIILTWLLLSPLSSARDNRDSELVVPMGALAQAASVLEKSTGGKVLEIRLANSPGPPAFEAVISKDDAVQYLRIASPSNDVTEIKIDELPPWLLNYKLDAYIRSVSKTQVPIEQAITKAEARDSAPAIDAGIARPLDGTNAVLAYFVETMKGHKRNELAVDATTGAFIANPDALYEPHRPVELARRLAQ